MMKAWIFGGLVALLVFPSALAFGQEENEDPIVFGFDFVPYVGTSTALPDVPRYFSFNLIGGMSGGVRVFELGGVFNLNDGWVGGAQIAGAVNLTSGDQRGLQIGGAANVTGGESQGLTLAGGVNIIGGSAQGMQTAGGVNMIGGNVGGARLAGGANVIGGDAQGMQVAGGLNLTGGDAQGMQISGGLNLTGGDAQGMQVTGGLNLTGGDAQGMQIAGGLNLTLGNSSGLQFAPVNISTGEVSGLQLGVLNIAGSSSASIGLIGIYLNGYVQPEAYLSDDGLMLVGIRHGSEAFYHVYSVGTRAFGGPSGIGPALAASLGFGWRLGIGERLEMSLDLTTTSVISQTREWDWRSHLSIFKFRPMLAVNVLDSLAIFGGPTLSLTLPNETATVGAEEFGLWEGWDLGGGVQMWPGVVVGVRLF